MVNLDIFNLVLLITGVFGPLQLLSDALTVTSEHQPLIKNALASADVLLAVINNLLVCARALS